MTPLEKRLEALRRRRFDPARGQVFLKEAALAKSLASPEVGDALKYISESAEPVPPDYTKKSFEECGRVQGQLEKAFAAAAIDVEFDHQGSVTNNTHIKLHSDIDLLALATAFFSLQPPLAPTNPYKGNPLLDLMRVRATAVASLKTAFPKATVDESKSRCVAIFGGSLERKIDVVPSNWLDTPEFRRTGDKAFRGIRVLDVAIPDRIDNFPFLHDHRLDVRDAETGGGLKRCIRIVKSICRDAEPEVDFSSYDIASLCYCVPVPGLLGKPDLALLASFLSFGRFC